MKGIRKMKRTWTDILIEVIAWLIVWSAIFAGCVLTYILK